MGKPLPGYRIDLLDAEGDAAGKTTSSIWIEPGRVLRARLAVCCSHVFLFTNKLDGLRPERPPKG